MSRIDRSIDGYPVSPPMQLLPPQPSLKALLSRFRAQTTAPSLHSPHSAQTRTVSGGVSSSLLRFRRSEAATQPFGSETQTKFWTLHRSPRCGIARRGTKPAKADRKRFGGSAAAIAKPTLRSPARFAAPADAATASGDPGR